jgi:hypothetical protein
MVLLQQIFRQPSTARDRRIATACYLKAPNETDTVRRGSAPGIVITLPDSWRATSDSKCLGTRTKLASMASARASQVLILECTFPFSRRRKDVANKTLSYCIIQLSITGSGRCR